MRTPNPSRVESPTGRNFAGSAVHAVALTLLSLFPSLAGAQTITAVPIFPGGGNSVVYGVNANGTAAAGYSNNSGGTDTALRWTSSGGSGNMGFLPSGGVNSYAQAIDSSGTILAGYGDSAGNSRAFRWTTTGGYQVLPLVPGTGFFATASGISASGARVVGTSGIGGGARAFMWDSSSPGFSNNLGLLPGQSSSGASAISGDGFTVVGSSGSQPFRWNAIGFMQGLGAPLPGQISALAEAVNTDGSVITGRYNTGSELGYRWTAATGMVALPPSPGGSIALRPRAISGDGNIIIGQVVDGVAGFTAFIWTPSGGTQLLPAHLTSRGVNLTGWQFTDATGISADGSAMCGTGYFGGQAVGWVVSGLSCPTLSSWGNGGNSNCIGTTRTFGASATGGAGLQWRWLKNGVQLANGPQPSGSNITGATTNAMYIANFSPGDGGNYQVAVSSAGACEVVGGVMAIANPFAGPSIITNPGDQTVCINGAPSLFAAANPAVGSAIYRWQKFVGPLPSQYIDITDGPSGNGSTYVGTGGTTFSIFGAQPADGIRYRCRIQDSVCGGASQVFTSFALITVLGSPTVTGPGDSYQCTGDNDAFIGVTVSPPGSYTYRWQKYVGPSASSYVDIFDGPTGNGGFFGQTGTATLGVYSFNPGEFNLYRCRVTGPCGSPTTGAPGLLTGVPFAAVLGGPSDTSQCPGDNDASFSITTTPGIATYQWQKFVGPSPTAYANIFNGPTGNGGNYGGTNSATLGIYGCYAPDFTRYRCVITDICYATPVTSPSALLLPTPEAIVTSGPTAAPACLGGSATLTVSATPAGSTYQWQKYNGPCISCYSNVINGPTGNGGSYIGAQSPTLTIIGINTPDSLAAYRCIVNGPCALVPAASPAAAFELLSNPVIQTNPVAGLACRGGSKTLSIALAPGNYGPVTYQWWRYVPAFPIYSPVSNGALPSGAIASGSQTPTLTLTGIQQQDAGQYYCSVTGCNSVPSSVATLTWCPADFNCSGTLEVADIFAFLNAWFAGNLSADFDGTSGLQIADIFAFLNAWFAGC